MFGFMSRRMKPIAFDYKPRFYDAEKEAREKRLEHKERVRNGDTDAIKGSLSATFSKERTPGSFGFVANRGKIRQQYNRKSNITRIIIFILLLGLAYWLVAVYLPRLEQMLQ